MKNMKMRTLALLFSLSMLVLCAATRVQGQASAPLVDMAKISDPKLKAAIDAIGRKVALINEIYVAEGKLQDPLFSFISERPVQLIFRRSGGFFFCASGLNKPQPQFTVTDAWLKNDGETFWTVLKVLAPDSTGGGQKKSAMIANRVDLDKVRAAGIDNKMTSASRDFNEFINPFCNMDLASLKLVEETAESWTFTGTPLPDEDSKVHGTTMDTFTVSKQTGLLVKESTEGKVPTSASYGQIRINPNPPILDFYFKFTPTVTTLVNDGTEEAIQESKKEMAAQAAPGQ